MQLFLAPLTDVTDIEYSAPHMNSFGVVELVIHPKFKVRGDNWILYFPMFLGGAIIS